MVDRGEPWWSQPGSNRRPLQCHCSALPAELWPHCWKRKIVRTAFRSVKQFRARRLCGFAGRLAQGRDAVPLLGEVLQPLAEEGVHAQAMVEQRGRRRVEPEHVLPATPDVAMRCLHLSSVVVDAQ